MSITDSLFLTTKKLYQIPINFCKLGQKCLYILYNLLLRDTFRLIHQYIGRETLDY